MIHPSAIVHPSAEIHSEVSVGPFAVIEDSVRVSEGCSIGAHAVLKRGLHLDARVAVHEGAVLGGAPQDRKFSGGEEDATLVEIGEGTVIREYVTVHRATRAGRATRVGRNCYLMGYAHVAHDCELGNDVTLASYSALAGHISVGRGAFISGGVVVHQFGRIGDFAFVGGGSKVNMDVTPYTTVDGVPARAVGLNTVGLRRAGFSDETILSLKRAFRIIFRAGIPRAEALAQIADMSEPEVKTFMEFIRSSERGVCRSR